MPVASFGFPGVAEAPDEVVLMRIELDGWVETPCWPAGVSVRTFRPEDAPAVHQLLVDAFAGAPEEILLFGEWHETTTTDPQFDPGAWFLAEEDGVLVGAALAWDDGFLKDLAVHPKARRRGIGAALLHHLFRELAGRGIDRVSLKVLASNHEARRLYERVGMTDVGRP